MAETKPARPEIELLGEIGRYHVRRIKKSKEQQVFEIREYVKADSFEGYTRRGIVLTIPNELNQLRRLLDSVK